MILFFLNRSIHFCMTIVNYRYWCVCVPCPISIEHAQSSYCIATKYRHSYRICSLSIRVSSTRAHIYCWMQKQRETIIHTRFKCFDQHAHTHSLVFSLETCCTHSRRRIFRKIKHSYFYLEISIRFSYERWMVVEMRSIYMLLNESAINTWAIDKTNDARTNAVELNK